MKQSHTINVMRSMYFVASSLLVECSDFASLFFFRVLVTAEKNVFQIEIKLSNKYFNLEN